MNKNKNNKNKYILYRDYGYLTDELLYILVSRIEDSEYVTYIDVNFLGEMEIEVRRPIPTGSHDWDKVKAFKMVPKLVIEECGMVYDCAMNECIKYIMEDKDKKIMINKAIKVHTIELHEAIKDIKDIQAEDIRKILCGSASLMLLNIMPPMGRGIHDLDFVFVGDKDDYLKMHNGDSISEIEKDAPFDGEDIIRSIKCNTISPHCLFYSNDINTVYNSIEKDGIRHQNPLETIRWKLKLNRDKDIDDILNIIEYLKGGLF